MMFMGGRVDFSSSMENSTLDIGNIIMSKIKEKEALLASGRPSSSYLEPKIIQVYSQYASNRLSWYINLLRLTPHSVESLRFWRNTHQAKFHVPWRLFRCWRIGKTFCSSPNHLNGPLRCVDWLVCLLHSAFSCNRRLVLWPSLSLPISLKKWPNTISMSFCFLPLNQVCLTECSFPLILISRYPQT